MSNHPKGARLLACASIMIHPKTGHFLLSTRGVDQQWHDLSATSLAELVHEARIFLDTQLYAYNNNPPTKR